ncbi:phosphonate metabolism protein/1,5-bisphosphokinase (PRPP-forming) PhnN [Pseudodesulfovibrio thermohalotolerans]|jgi:ribose 1,5-bisphosphokinase|uniref:phosphonate metabolism protein/1,5-bisphosphokinase (PRPP-forming) PhnN n=1 Tax=Pseudodesulfovibrio thermohalotolerans TaxID=2880651 RepID=UPI0022B9EDE2|nr:phosphonate metabolism protein/1,5-bisphosphokinase (PRPP-forming) PhnN [Pseudodesulfovibrio thermohalotolerans]WFS64255.1 phosphonate metabolism protein/1,5-bisphosphokinase (PRPP-forming) PhnN [Pseudodesulfovibrio thermohalotolerans]
MFNEDRKMKANLIYIMGASGSGKDSLMRYAREKLAKHTNIVFAHRYITRPADVGGENHVSLSPDEFSSRVAAGLFALHWQSHGYYYGIGIEIDLWLTRGLTVIVNGSRKYLQNVYNRYTNVVPILIEVSPDILRLRLQNRNRETGEQIEKRLQRHQILANACEGCLKVNNDGQLNEGGDTLIDLILHYSVNDFLHPDRGIHP